MDWGSATFDVVKVLGGVLGGWLVGRRGYLRQRRDQQADRQREADKGRMAPFTGEIERAEPFLRKVKGLIDDAATRTGGLGPFLMIKRSGRRHTDPDLEWALDVHHEDIRVPLLSASRWLNAHVPELRELGLSPDLHRDLGGLLARFDDVYNAENDEGYRDAVLELYALVAPLRDELRLRFRHVPPTIV